MLTDLGLVFASLQEKWDDKKNATENLRSFGLAADPNEDLAGRNRKKTTASGEVPFVQFVHVPVSDALHQIDEQNPRRRVMSEEDQKYCAALLKKHGQDYAVRSLAMRLRVLLWCTRVCALPLYWLH